MQTDAKQSDDLTFQMKELKFWVIYSYCHWFHYNFTFSYNAVLYLCISMF